MSTDPDDIFAPDAVDDAGDDHVVADEGPVQHVALGAVLDRLDAGAERAAEETAAALLKTARTPPAAMDAERAVLGAVLLDPTVYDDVVDAGLVADDFYREAHGAIWRVVVDLRAAGEPADTLTVVDELQRRGELDAVGGAAAVAQLEAMLPTAAHAGAYAKLVREKAILRALIALGRRIVESAYRQDRRVSEILADAERDVMDVGAARAGMPIVDRETTVLEVVDALQNPNAPPPPVVPTGLVDLDATLGGGLPKGELIILAGRPAMGKTTAGLAIAAHIADNVGPVAFVSLEMPGRQLIRRELAAAARLPANPEIWQRPSEASRASAAASRVYKRPLHIVDRPGLPLEDLGALLRRMVSSHGIVAAVVDHIGLVVPPAEWAGMRAQQLGAITRTLRAGAGQLGIPIVGLCQLNRGVEGRNVKRPMLSDLRDSGNIEEDASIVAFLHRPEYYLRNVGEDVSPDLERLAEFCVAKNRHGPTEIVPAIFDGATYRVMNRSNRSQP